MPKSNKERAWLKSMEQKLSGKYHGKNQFGLEKYRRTSLAYFYFSVSSLI